MTLQDLFFNHLLIARCSTSQNYRKQIRRFTIVCTSSKKITKTDSNHNEFQEFNKKYSLYKNIIGEGKNYRTDVHDARTKPFVPSLSTSQCISNLLYDAATIIISLPQFMNELINQAILLYTCI